MKTLKKLNNPYLPAIIGTVALLILGQCLSKGFLSMNNISSILMTTSILTLASIGQAAVIISGDSGLDMSVGAIMSMTALFGPMINVGSGVASFILMIPAVMLMGAVVGAINGTGVQMLKVVPLVMTLIMSNVVDGFYKRAAICYGRKGITGNLKNISRSTENPANSSAHCFDLTGSSVPEKKPLWKKSVSGR